MALGKRISLPTDTVIGGQRTPFERHRREQHSQICWHGSRQAAAARQSQIEIQISRG